MGWGGREEREEGVLEDGAEGRDSLGEVRRNEELRAEGWSEATASAMLLTFLPIASLLAPLFAHRRIRSRIAQGMLWGGGATAEERVAEREKNGGRRGQE